MKKCKKFALVRLISYSDFMQLELALFALLHDLKSWDLAIR